MAAALPRPSRPTHGPPTSALPALPTAKPRKVTGNISPTEGKTGSNLPRSGLRAPSSSHLATPSTPVATSTLPKLRTTPAVNGAGKTLRKTISINAFPQPPRGGVGAHGVRTSSLPPSPLVGGSTTGLLAPSPGLTRKDSTGASPVTPGPNAKRSKPPSAHASYSSTPSLLNGSGDTRSISSGQGVRGSDGLLSLPSPPQSRSSSAQDSYSTSATTFEDTGDGVRGRDSSVDFGADKRGSKGEVKGNVLVSVRVRPDAGSTGDHAKNEGEWMVDGRRSLVAYKGKEGGDYYYGNAYFRT